ncbi:urea active transporter protein [Echinococcus multilocularis]|uniref:Urea active transporter protein n=1 Tax=Echinococcus multilocularis TaxID=6211 RepID=A0A068YIC3_ECHMU|nr:urea active transporter protein [Echinococcus multilocularis]
MEDVVFDEFVHIRPKPGVVLNVSRRLPSSMAQECRNLQKSFRTRKHQVLRIEDVVVQACIILLVVFVADSICTLCTRKRKHTTTQSGFTSSSDRPHSFGIVISSFMVQITWPISILEAVRNAEMYGLVGCIFVSANGTLVCTIFALLLLELRTKAPGAQTIAQFVGHRFGRVAHILTITISILTALYTLTINVTVGSMVLNEVAENVSKTAIVSIVFILIGAMLVVARRRSYSLTLYIILITILLICASLLFIVLNMPAYSPLGSVNSLYKLLVCYNKSVYGIRDSKIGGFDVEIVSDNLANFIHRLVRVLFDQTLWETSINLPPNHGVLGLLLASIMAFCIPFALGVVCGLGFRALESAFFNAALLNETQKASGLVIFAIPIHLLNKTGIRIIFIVILLLLVTSCMFSIAGASSILYHDVLMTYIRPFKRQVDRATCLLCGKRRGHLASRRNICRCRSMLECAACHADTWIKEECSNRPATTLVYGCQTHGAYRAYTDEMSKRVLHISFTVLAGTIPIFIIFSEVAAVNFIYFSLCTPFVGCLCLSILWARLSRVALLIGYFVSAGASLILWFVLDNATSLETKKIRLIGMNVALLGGFLLPALLTLLLTKPLSPKVARGVWSCVQEIDNPLVPWPEVYTRQTDLRFSPRLSEKKPALSEILGPAMRTLDFNRFVFYVESIEIWTYLSTIFCLAFPLVLLVSYQGAYLRLQFHRLRMVIRSWSSRLYRGRTHQQ